MKNGRQRVFEVSVESAFHATHAVTVDGIDETPHEHDWKVEVLVNGPKLDADGLLLDFLDLESNVDKAIAPLRNADLNSAPVLNQKNPSAEVVAIDKYFNLPVVLVRGLINPVNSHSVGCMECAFNRDFKHSLPSILHSPAMRMVPLNNRFLQRRIHRDVVLLNPK